MTLKNFRSSDFDKDVKNVKTVSSKRDRSPAKPVPTTKPVVAPNADPEDVPSGTTPEILSWVGDDVVRAQKALDVEVENAKPRAGLVKQLVELIDAE